MEQNGLKKRNYILLLHTLFIMLVIFPLRVSGSNIETIIKTIIPVDCTDKCSNWSSNVITCVNNTPESISISFNLKDTNENFGSMVTGDKFGLYLCICAQDTISWSTPCLECLSSHFCFSTPITAETYQQICNGNNLWT